MKHVLVALFLTTQPVLAQNFTTAAEVKPILGLQKDRWVAVREYDGRDLVYFTSILSWRCGLEAIHYGLNGAVPDTPYEMENCHEDTSAPNALTGKDGTEVYITQPLGSVETVSIRLTFDDGSEETAEYERAKVLMP